MQAYGGSHHFNLNDIKEIFPLHVLAKKMQCELLQYQQLQT